MTDLRKAAEMALLTLEGWSNHGEWVWPESALLQSKRNTVEGIEALRQALAQGEPPPSYEYAEIRIRVGDLHIKSAITPDQFLKSHDPFKLLSLLANECIQNIKEQA